MMLVCHLWRTSFDPRSIYFSLKTFHKLLRCVYSPWSDSYGYSSRSGHVPSPVQFVHNTTTSVWRQYRLWKLCAMHRNSLPHVTASGCTSHDSLAIWNPIFWNTEDLKKMTRTILVPLPAVYNSQYCSLYMPDSEAWSLFRAFHWNVAVLCLIAAVLIPCSFLWFQRVVTIFYWSVLAFRVNLATGFNSNLCALQDQYFHIATVQTRVQDTICVQSCCVMSVKAVFGVSSLNALYMFSLLLVSALLF